MVTFPLVSTVNLLAIVPEGTNEMTVSWPGDTWPNEVLFLIVAPDGTQFAFRGAEENTRLIGL